MFDQAVEALPPGTLWVPLEEIFGMRALDIYGLSEVLGPGVSMECAEGRNGLHVWERGPFGCFLPEVVDPGTGAVLPDGSVGELVLTTPGTLWVMEAMPVIRYRTGDLTRLIAEPCVCGRTHRRMARVQGRTDDMLIVRGVNVFPSEIERVLLAIPELSPHYQIVLERPGTLWVALDSLEVRVERHGDAGGDEASRAALGALVLRELEAALGISTAVVIEPPGALPRSEGKAQRVVDRRGQ